jgi:hypothetical protein
MFQMWFRCVRCSDYLCRSPTPFVTRVVRRSSGLPDASVVAAWTDAIRDPACVKVIMIH